MQIVVLGLYTAAAHLPHFLPKLIAKKLRLMSLELEKVEITPCYELVRGLEQALGCIQQLEVVVHSECQYWLAAEAANQ